MPAWNRGLFPQRCPVDIALGDKSGNVLFPLYLHVSVVVEVQLAIDDFPDLGIAGKAVIVGGSPGTMAAILGGIAIRISLECGQVLRGGELEGGALVDGGKLVAAFDRAPLK